MNISEISDLKWKHLRNGAIQISKTNSTTGLARRIKLSRALTAEFDNLSKKTEHVFSSRQSPRLSPRRIEQIVRQTLDLQPRQLRKEFIRKTIAAAKDATQARKRTGLRSLQQKKSISRLKLRYQDARDKIVLRLLYETGCRVSELVAIRQRHVRQYRVKLPGRNLKISPALYSLIKAHDGDFAFGKKLTVRRIQQICSKYCANRIRLTPQLIRNSYAHRRQNQGLDVKQIEEEMGIRITAYTHGIT